MQATSARKLSAAAKDARPERIEYLKNNPDGEPEGTKLNSGWNAQAWDTAEVKVESRYTVEDIAQRSRDGDAGPQIVDIFLTGTISELATRRSEFSAVLQQGGYQALLATLERKTAAQAAGADTQ